ncbi:type II toxin-antitoxin system Phd/YefM family antitoxin [Luteimonas sp. gir]|uniref:type II toxin-antitoxin system Phd/YefM family antitoxin n=1 Tax=Luteimonas sp. gir TaxID=3127960 RepID=UPI003075B303
MIALSSSQFRRNVGRATRESERGPVLITQRGEPAYVLLSIQDYRRLVVPRRTLADALAMPGAAAVELDLPRLRDYPPMVNLASEADG